MAYTKLIVYYFSGTGNSKNVAVWMSKVAKEIGIPYQLINIADTNRREIEQPEAGALIVFVSPVHGFNYPPVMMNFVMRFPRGKNRVLLMNTRAGMLIGKLITPGLSGITFYFASLFLILKGYSIKGMFPVDLPSNWMSLHPSLNTRTVAYLHDRNREKVTQFARKTITGGSNYKALYEIVQDLVIAPISLGYYFVGRFLFSKSFYASHDCDHCGVCIKGCPVKAIKTVEGRPYWTFNCESCMKCMSSCPKRAIETGHGFMAGFMVLFSSVLMVLFYKYFELYFFAIKNEIARFVVETGIFLSLLALWYRIIHYLLRFRFFERIVVYTSLTRYKFWGKRYKALKE